MSIKLLRAGIRSWLASRTRIDAWDLDVPANVPTVLEVGDPPVKQRYPANCAVELPVKDLGIKHTNAGYTEGQGRFTYALLYRFSGKAAKTQLPVAAVENLVNYLLEYAANHPQALWADIRALEINPIADPVSIARIEGEDQDWLVIGRLEFNVQFLSEAISPDGSIDLSPLQPPTPAPTPRPPITTVRTGLYRATYPVDPGDPTTYVLDRNLEIPLPPP